MTSEFSTGSNISYGTDQLRVPLRATFEPMEDITAYEIAMLLPYLTGRWLYQEDLTALGDAARHLKTSNHP